MPVSYTQHRQIVQTAGSTSSWPGNLCVNGTDALAFAYAHHTHVGIVRAQDSKLEGIVFVTAHIHDKRG